MLGFIGFLFMAIVFGLLGFFVAGPVGAGAAVVLLLAIMLVFGLFGAGARGVARLAKGPPRRCQFCDSQISPKAIVCPHCQRDLASA